LNEALLDFSEIIGQSRGAEDLAPIVFKVLEDFGIVKKLYCITSDSVSNNFTMSEGLSVLIKQKSDIEWDNESRHILCLAHIIHNVVKTFLRTIKASASEPGEDPESIVGFECSVLLEKYAVCRKRYPAHGINSFQSASRTTLLPSKYISIVLHAGGKPTA
jgi:hypothetical protein